jgi:hypothetical protein
MSHFFATELSNLSIAFCISSGVALTVATFCLNLPIQDHVSFNDFSSFLNVSAVLLAPWANADGEVSSKFLALAALTNSSN